MSNDNMSRNAEHYADQTPCAAFRSIQKDERQKEAARLTFDRVLTAQALRLSRTEALGGIAFVLCLSAADTSTAFRGPFGAT